MLPRLRRFTYPSHNFTGCENIAKFGLDFRAISPYLHTISDMSLNFEIRAPMIDLFPLQI